MARLPELGRISDAEYKMLTSEDLMRYNKTMPEMDYNDPYLHKPFPKAMYSYEGRDDGSGTLLAVKVEDEAGFKKLLKESKREWKESPGAWGVETAPGAPAFAMSDTPIEVPTRRVS